MDETTTQTPTQEMQSQQVPMVREETDEGIMMRWTDAAINVATNIDMQDEEGRAMLTRCMSTADLKTRNGIGLQIEAVAYFAHVVEITDTETGQIDKKVRAVLVLKDGRTFSTSSKACVRTISVLAKATQGKAWDPPLLLEVREFPLEGGRSYCDLREVVREKGKKK